jgi:hypothetical protein
MTPHRMTIVRFHNQSQTKKLGPRRLVFMMMLSIDFITSKTQTAVCLGETSL